VTSEAATASRTGKFTEAPSYCNFDGSPAISE